jgi:Ca2+-transporting ATPase
MGQVHSIPLGHGTGSVDPPLVAAIVHSIPLRDRLKIAGLRHDQERANELCELLRKRGGISRLRFNRAAASLTIDYESRGAQAELAATLAALPLDIKLAPRGEAPSATGTGRRSTGDKKPDPVTSGPGREPATDWHIQELKAVLETLQSDPRGLSPEEAERRLQEYGPNLLAKLERRSDWHILREQFQSAPVAMLGVSAAIALLTAAPLDASVIAIVVGTNAAIGFLTERQAEDTIANLATIKGQQLKVLRDSSIVEIDASEVVRGDVLLLEPGSRLPADARLIKAHHLTVDESSLTGESLPVVKKARNCDEPRTLADRKNMVHLGTVVSGGDGRAVVVETGDDTELGQIQSLASGNQRPMTPMQEQLATVSTQLAVLSSGVCALVFAVGLLRGQPRLAMLNTAISLAVAAVPEGLPAISNSLLAIGIRRMRKQNVLARHLDAIENLGAIDVLCIDKTGTLTENRMQVMEAHCGNQVLDFTAGEEARREMVDAIDERFWRALVLCNESVRDGDDWQGSPTENALLEGALKVEYRVDAVRESMPCVKIRYRSEKRPYMASIHRYPRKKGYFVAVKGRPRQVLARCSHIRKGKRRVRLSDAMREQILRRNVTLMQESYRVLGVAWKHQDDDKLGKTEDLEWLGLVAMADPLRPEVNDLLPRLQEAGIRTIILTGDQRGTAAAIGRKAGLMGDAEIKVLGADELEQLSEGELLEEIKKTQVFARVSPAMKLKLVQALQRSGHRVAMTGDGINDGPALRVADVGIAMGRNGSEVARSMSDVVLTDDRLQSIIDAMAHGRGSFSNLQKAIEYLLSTNFSEIQITLAAIAAGLPTPLSPIQLLWINLMTDVFPSLAIGFEAPEWDVLKQPPEEFKQGVINRRRLGDMLRQSLIISGGTLTSYLYGLGRYGVGQKANTQAFMTLTFAQLLQSISSRSRSSSIFRPQGPPANPWLRGALVGSLVMQLGTGLPGVRRIFGVSPMGPVDMAFIAAGSIIPLLINEALKKTEDEGQDSDG